MTAFGMSRLPSRKISRDEIFQYVKSPLNRSDLTFVMIMAWGGMTEKNGKLAWSDRFKWLPIVRKMLLGRLNAVDAYQAFSVARTAGMGPAYFTKLIYFCTKDRVSFSGYIMDQWTAKSINLLFDSPRIKLTSSGYVSRNNSKTIYRAYCYKVRWLATKLGQGPDEIEERLFSHRRGEWRNHLKKFSAA